MGESLINPELDVHWPLGGMWNKVSVSDVALAAGSSGGIASSDGPQREWDYDEMAG